MKKDKFTQAYLDIIKESQDWKDSLGGKLVTGIGTLFKGGAKAVSSIGKGIDKGVTKGSQFATKALVNYIKDRHTRQNFREIVDRIHSIYDPDTSPTSTLIEHKSELIYIVTSSKDALPGSLSEFLNIFDESGKEIKSLITNDTSINVNVTNIVNLIKQPISLKIDNFKSKIEAAAYSKIVKENTLYTDTYLNILYEATSGEALNAFNIFKTNTFTVDKSTPPYELHKSYTNNQLSNILSGQIAPSGILFSLRQIIINDKLNMKINITNDNIQYAITSEAISQQFKKSFSTTDDPIIINNEIQTGIRDFYNYTTNQKARKSRLEYAKLRNLTAILRAGNQVIDSFKWRGFFGSLEGVLRDAADCKLNINDIQFLAKIYFHIALLKN